MMDSNKVENRLKEIDDKVDLLQEPISQAIDDIEKLIDSTKGTESEDLMEFKIKLLEIIVAFSEAMANMHDDLIEDCEGIERIMNKK
jgi:hypothetical protein